MADRNGGVVSAIYAAAMKGESWSDLMGQVGRFLGAHSAFMFTSPSETDSDSLLVMNNISPQMGEEFLAGWRHDDLWTLCAARLGCMSRGTVVLGDELISRDQFRRSRYFNEFTRRYQIEAMLGSVVFDGTEGPDVPFTNLCWYQEPGRDGFTRDDQRKLRKILPHFQQALLLQHRLRRLAAQSWQFESTAASRGTASLLLDDKGQVLHANSLAQSLLDTKSSLLRFHGNRLRGLGSRCAPAFEQALLLCKSGHPVSLLVQHDGEPRALIRATLVEVPTEAQTHLGFFETPHLLLVLEMPRDDSQVLVRRAAELFGFTPAEQKVAVQLLTGRSPDEIAQAHGTSLNTVRTQVRSILTKSGLVRQIDLVRVFSRLQA